MRRLALIALSACAGCATTPTVVTKTVTVPVPTPVLQKLPAELTKDCPPAPITGTQLGQILTREASVEAALKTCRDQLARIRELP